MHNRSAFMKSVWAQFCRVANPRQAFDRKLFGQVLAFMWKSERTRLQAERERQARAAELVSVANTPRAVPAPLSEMEARIDALEFMSARYPIGRMAAEIRAEYAHA